MERVFKMIYEIIFIIFKGILHLYEYISDIVCFIARFFIWKIFIKLTQNRSSHWRRSIKRSVLENFTRKHRLCSFFLIKLQTTLLKRDSISGVLLWILRNFKEHPLTLPVTASDCSEPTEAIEQRMFCDKKCSEKFRKIHRKIHAPVSLLKVH